ncbi:linear amide C-N hydrolase [Planctomyces sp. SH-PL62]|uniref:linear amide C-N hydrolase n=1 Tax=Planctomyces sp. SH-PL62 TaxID=1636152 RepID=UPI00078EDF8C|nr:linear amide C-N hydrolase [Planctomyces sp. SH-PL62]AMV36307.1 Choloylglycine hydrolase [Planctomyces sp. SH-PL62]
MNAKRLFGMFVALACCALGPSPLEACTRCVYLGPEGRVLVARSMDWMEDPGTNLYILPRGMERDGAAGPRSLKWASKYGSVVCSFYEVASVDGMNEKGLVANTLYLVESDYGRSDGDRPVISIAAWAQYVLDNFATVAEAVEALRAEPFSIVAPILPNNDPAQGHLAIVDPSGDSAVFEYVKGKLVIHHGREFRVMTNSPTFDQQLALDEYWKEIGGETMLPGTSRAADRFVRASFYIDAVPKTDDARQALASLFGVIRNTSVPLGITTPGRPNIASTVWRTAYDLKDRTLYFDSATSPTIFWATLDAMDFEPGAPVKKLALAGGRTFSGDATSEFEPSSPFPFLPGKPE